MSNSVARITTITSRSGTSFEDAIASGIERASATLRGIEGAWVKEQSVQLSDGRITTWQVVLEVTFVLDDGPMTSTVQDPVVPTI